MTPHLASGLASQFAHGRVLKRGLYQLFLFFSALIQLCLYTVQQPYDDPWPITNTRGSRKIA